MEIAVDTANNRAGLILLGGFLASFLFIRMSTRLMRSPKVPWWPGSIETEGIHIHHHVFGIVLMIVTGFVSFAVAPGSPWLEILAGGFGIGVGLTVDEFALWLYLDDVYWTKEGRASIDAGVICFALAALVILGQAPSFDEQGGSPEVVTVYVLEQLAWATVVVAKGKPRLALLSFFVPILGIVCAIRLARPRSWWARRFYGPDSKKLAKATARAERWDERRVRWLDRIGGTPHLERQTGPGDAP